MNSIFVNRIIRACKLDTKLYEEVEADKSATLQAALVVVLSIYHEYLGKCLNHLKNKTNTKTSKYYRYLNEVPTVLLILIVFIVIIKPL